MFHGNNINHEDVSALSLIQRKGRCTQNLQVNSERFFVCSVQNELRKKFLGKAVYLGFAISVPCVVTYSRAVEQTHLLLLKADLGEPDRHYFGRRFFSSFASTVGRGRALSLSRSANLVFT